MVKKIFKYKLPDRLVPGWFEIEMPSKPSWCWFAIINGTPWIYAVVDPETNADKGVARFYLAWTGHPLPPEFDDGWMSRLDTFQVGELVWHIFYENIL